MCRRAPPSGDTGTEGRRESEPAHARSGGSYVHGTSRAAGDRALSVVVYRLGSSTAHGERGRSVGASGTHGRCRRLAVGGQLRAEGELELRAVNDCMLHQRDELSRQTC